MSFVQISSLFKFRFKIFICMYLCFSSISRQSQKLSHFSTMGKIFPIVEIDTLERTNVPEHEKTYNMTCVTSKDSDQAVHPPSLARVFV